MARPAWGKCVPPDWVWSGASCVGRQGSVRCLLLLPGQWRVVEEAGWGEQRGVLSWLQQNIPALLLSSQSTSLRLSDQSGAP